MALKARLAKDEHGKLAESVRPLYVEKDGMFFLDVEETDGWRLDNSDLLRKALGTERKRADDNEAVARELKKQFEGLDAAKARDALERLKEIDAGDLEGATKRKLKSLEDQLTAKYAAEIDPLRKSLTDREAEIDALTVDREIGDALGKLQLIDGGRELLASHVKTRGVVRRVRGSDGKSVVRVFGDDGNELVTREQGKSGPMSVTELMSTILRKQFPGVYVASKQSGSGAQGSSGGEGNGNTNLSGTALIEQGFKSSTRG